MTGRITLYLPPVVVERGGLLEAIATGRPAAVLAVTPIRMPAFPARHSPRRHDPPAELMRRLFDQEERQRGQPKRDRKAPAVRRAAQDGSIGMVAPAPEPTRFFSDGVPRGQRTLMFAA